MKLQKTSAVKEVSEKEGGTEQNDVLRKGFEMQVEGGKRWKREGFKKGGSCDRNLWKRNGSWRGVWGLTRKVNMKKQVKKKDRKVKVTRTKTDRKEKFGNEWSLPVLVLEKVFSYLDWRDLGRAMLVCHRWKEVGGHPSLWIEFPLQLDSDTLNPLFPESLVPKIRRLDWLKSLTINLSNEGIQGLVLDIQYHGIYMLNEHVYATEAFPRLEELLIFCDEIPGYPVSKYPIPSILEFLKTNKNKLARFGIRHTYHESWHDTSEYDWIFYVSSCDTDSIKYLKKTLNGDTPKKETNVSIFGLPGVYLSNELLETVCSSVKEGVVELTTNLKIDQSMDLGTLTCLLKDNVHYLHWDLHWDSEDLEKQEVAPLNAILDVLLGSASQGKFESLEVPKSLLLKSDRVGRLGGRANVEAAQDGDCIRIHKCSTSSAIMVGDLGDEEHDHPAPCILQFDQCWKRDIVR